MHFLEDLDDEDYEIAIKVSGFHYQLDLEDFLFGHTDDDDDDSIGKTICCCLDFKREHDPRKNHPVILGLPSLFVFMRIENTC